MDLFIDLLLFTIGPIVVMTVSIAYSIRGIYQLSDYRPLLLVALLGLMILHQSTELIDFSVGGFLQFQSRPAEAFESGANVLASVGSIFVVQYLKDLKTTEVELEESNAALRERSMMVNVLNRILRHNVRNDVTAIAGQAEIALEQVDDEETRKKLATIQERAWDLSTVSNRTQRIRRLLSEEPTEKRTLRLPRELHEPIETVLVNAPSVTISLDDPKGVDLTTRVPTTFTASLIDVLEQMISYNDGDVAIEISVSGKHSQFDENGSIVIGIDDDGGGLPDLDIQTVKHGEETPLMHAQDVALWCLSWAVERANGTLDLDPEEGTFKIHLPQSVSGGTH